LRERSELKRSSGVERETWIRFVEKEQAKSKEEVKALNNKIAVLNDERIRGEEHDRGVEAAAGPGPRGGATAQRRQGGGCG
jgi:hypothetical protein